jgi:hypothetical protein
MRKITSLLMLFCMCVGMAWGQLIQTSTAESPIYYVIASYNRGGVITYDEVGGAILHKAATNDGKCEWYFEAVPGNTDGGVYVVNKCKNGEGKLYLDADKKVSTTPAVWYVLENGVNNEGVSISSTATISGSNCLDANNSNSGIGSWAPNAGDWHGTTWVLFADMENAKYNPNKYINQQGQGGRSINSITINGATKTTSTYGLAYADHTSRVEFKVAKGSDVAISIARSGNWMHAYAYVDKAADGFTAEDYVSYSYLSSTNANSAGVANGNNTIVLPNFTAPNTVGTYRLRVKYDWDDLDPNGGAQFITAGSQFVDVILNVVDNPLAPVIPQAEILYASAKDNTGDKIGEYPTDKVNALAAAIEAAKAIADDAATADDVATLQAAMDAVKMILPTVGQYYQFHSSLTAFKETKALYSNGSAPRWKTLNDDDKSFYWKAVDAGNGNVVFQNAADGKYLAGNADQSGAWTVVDTPTAASNVDIKIFNKENNAKGYEYGVVLNGWQMHCNGHGGGAGTESNIVSWDTNSANSASSWFLVPVDLKVFHDITYNFVYDENVKYSQKTSVAEGAAYPAVVVPVLPYGVTANATTPDGNVTGAKSFNFELTVEHELPFETAADVNNITTWYYAQMHANPDVTSYVEDNKNGNNNVEWADKTVTADEIDSHLWGFAGDIWTGIKMVNKGTNRAIVSTSGSAVMGDKANATAFIPVYSNGAYNPNGWFCLKYPNSNYLNASGDKINAYNNADNGSSFLLTRYKETNVEVSAAGYATLYLGQPTYIPADVEVYAITGIEGNWATMTAVEGVLPANTGVILKNEGEYTFKVAGATGSVEGNLLLGTLTDTYVEGDAYVLANGVDGVGFYKAQLNCGAAGEAGGSHFKNNANKAYLPMTATQGANMLRFNFGGETTAIDAVEVENANAPIYDLSGRRVLSTVKGGIYIQNGKKFIVK